MYPHPAVIEALVRDRVLELRRSAVGRTRGRREKRRHRVTAAARHGTGWLLVDVGLRLAVPRGVTGTTMPRAERTLLSRRGRSL
jgi:hypothetical protein